MQQNQPQSMHLHADDLQQCSLRQLNQTQAPDDSVLVVREANQWITESQGTAIPKMLFGKFWHQGEVCILFADSNLGKRILAVQIADAITKGSANYPFDVEAEAQPVVYCDFELTEKQFEARYSTDYTNHYRFEPGFLRAKLNPDTELPNGFDDFGQYLIHALERKIVDANTKVIIIDNLTYLSNETEQASIALPLMKQLKNLKNKYGLSILALAHTPKSDLTQGITRNHLQGSKMLMNFCDSAFAIGESSTDSTLRYLKQIKQRNTEQLYGEDNVCLCRINKPHNFLSFKFEGFGREWQQLADRKKDNSEEQVQQALQLRNEGLSLREIGKVMGISHQKADRLLKEAI